MATLKVSGVSESQADRWDRARGFESFASWARRALDAAAENGGVLAERGLAEAGVAPRDRNAPRSASASGGLDAAAGSAEGPAVASSPDRGFKRFGSDPKVKR